MRIVDCFTDVILYARKLSRGEVHVESASEALDSLKSLFDQARTLSDANDLSSTMFKEASFPVIAFVDELFMCSTWAYKSDWKVEPLQRVYFNTTNAGSEFYDRLSVLNKHGPDKDVREVYALCLGLGFLGKYFRGEDRQRYEEIKAFNLSLLLPDEAEKNIDSATLFPTAYRGHRDYETASFKPRLNIYPVLIGVPLIIIIVLALYFHLEMASTLNDIEQLIKY